MSLRQFARSFGVISVLHVGLIACMVLPPEAVDTATAEGFSPPQVIALAGADLLVQEGSRVQLDGHASRSLVEGEDVRLSWSQLDGPPVTLTNPTSAAPAFVAPLAPANLRFRLRARAGVDENFDEVVVAVHEGPAALPLYVELPADGTVGSEAVTVEASIVGSAEEQSTALSVDLRCGGQATATVAENRIHLAGTLQIPCVVVVDAVGASGRRAAPAAHVLWAAESAEVEATQLDAPVLVEAGAVVSLAFADAPGATTWVWPTSTAAEALISPTYGPNVSIVAPPRFTRFIVGAERRVGPRSGGVRYAVIDVTLGAGNRAPLTCGGDDRRVRPGGRFALATDDCLDPDGDPVEVNVTQTLGDIAEEDDIQTGVFQAPESPGTLLFLVQAFDGRVWSAPRSVRVVVDPAALNVPPELYTSPQRWVRPATDFRLDASSASDPDSGLVVGWSIAQDLEDEHLLLPEPHGSPSVELRSGQAGEVYHFRLSARDEEGGVVVADVTVVVEDAGPYVDRLTGDDETGNGTPDAPVETLERALAIAARHELPELRIAAGTQSELPDTVEHIVLRG
ncbi:MAG: PKD domain-containing protein, partial [Myxococcota bacterium]